MSEFYTFELVICLSKLNSRPFFLVLPVDVVVLKPLAAVLGLTLFLFSFVDVNVLNNWPQYWASTFLTIHFALHSWKLRQHHSFFECCSRD